MSLYQCIKPSLLLIFIFLLENRINSDSFDIPLNSNWFSAISTCFYVVYLFLLHRNICIIFIVKCQKQNKHVTTNKRIFWCFVIVFLCSFSSLALNTKALFKVSCFNIKNMKHHLNIWSKLCKKLFVDGDQHFISNIKKVFSNI